LEAKLHSEIDNGNDAATEIDDSFHKARHLRHGRDLLHANDFANLQNGDAVCFVVEYNGQVFPGQFGGDDRSRSG